MPSRIQAYVNASAKLDRRFPRVIGKRRKVWALIKERRSRSGGPSFGPRTSKAISYDVHPRQLVDPAAGRAEAEAMTPRQFGDMMRVETERWIKVARGEHFDRLAARRCAHSA